MIGFRTLGIIELRGHDGREPVVLQPKRLAVLAYLVLAKPRGYHRRDTVAALFWPEVEGSKARAALSRVIYLLREELGEEAVLSRGDHEIGVDHGRIRCDAVLLEDLYATREWRQALDVYHGDLLAGFYVSDAAPEFDQWLDERRTQLRTLAADAAWKLADDAESRGSFDEAIRFGHRALDLQPGNESALRRVMELLDRAGDKAAAAGIYKDFSARMAAEFELEPSPETQQLLERIRARRNDNGAQIPAQLQQSTVAAASAAPGDARPTPSRAPFVTAIMLAVMAALIFTWRVMANRTTSAPAIAVGVITTDLPGDSVRAFAALLTTNLAGVDNLQVISEQRILELRVASPDSANASKVARAAGAREIIEGVLSRGARGLRFDFRRVDSRTGDIRAAHTVESRDIHEIIDLAVERIAHDFKLTPPLHHRMGSSRSLVAYRFYEEGLRAYYERDYDVAERLWRNALREDSTFAMAAYQLSKLVDFDRLRVQALRFAHEATDRERLYIQSSVAAAYADPRSLVLAESLAVRFPNDLDGQINYGHALIAEGRFLEALPYFERVVVADSANMSSAAACKACDALSGILTAYFFADSSAASFRNVQRWRRLQPNSWSMWQALADSYAGQGKIHEALAAYDTAVAFKPVNRLNNGEKATIWLQSGMFEEYDQHVAAQLRSGDKELKADAYWAQAISFKMQGRRREALEAARNFKVVQAELNKRPLIGEAHHEAVILMDIGRYREAAAIFDTIANIDKSPINPSQSRHRMWWFSHAATAYAALKDTARLRQMEDSVRVNGARTNGIRNRRLHHYVRGLRYAAHNRHGEAIAEFRRAMITPYYGHIGVNIGLAQSLLAAGRNEEAVDLLRKTRRMPLSSVGLYANRTYVHELLGTAFERANQPDSALIQYHWVLHALKKADPEMLPRRRYIESRVAALSRSIPIRP